MCNWLSLKAEEEALFTEFITTFYVIHIPLIHLKTKLITKLRSISESARVIAL